MYETATAFGNSSAAHQTRKGRYSLQMPSSIVSLIIAIASVLFFILSGHQLFYLLVPQLFRLRGIPEAAKPGVKCAVLICARNEEGVLPKLIESIKNQTYSTDVFVMADNCTDNTAEASRKAGAIVWERFNKTLIGKGYALSVLLKNMQDEGYVYDRYFIFDADNILTPTCIEEMNKVFDAGFPIVTGYRASKNFGDNWISAGYGLFFLRESRFLNYSRMLLGTSAAVSGTGFGFTHDILCEQTTDGELWPFHLLTEDLQFTAHHIINGKRIGYAHNAIYYDEQPTGLIQSWHQRMRWSKGGLQVVRNYGWRMLKNSFKGKFACYDMLMSSFPASIYNLICVFCNLILVINGCISGDVPPMFFAFLQTAGAIFLTFMLMGALTMFFERKRIHISTFKKILYTVTFPLFMMTYIPISLASFFCKVEWKPIKHKSS